MGGGSVASKSVAVTVKDLSPDQREAYDGILAWATQPERQRSKPVLSLAGFAGSGKSSLTGIIGNLPQLQPIAFCAFTGKASSVLRGKLASLKPRSRCYNQENPAPSPKYQTSFCSTIHSLIFVPIIVKEQIVGWEKREELDADYKLIIIDEMSMVNDEMLLDLRSFGIPILAVGDHGQLAPVSGTGSLMANPDLRLEKIHRQAEGNPIIALSKSIRETGRLDKSLAGEHIKFARLSGLDRLLEERYSGDPDLDELVTIVYTNARRVGLNLKARKLLTKSGPPNVGDQLVCLKNVKGHPVYNGMRGIVTKSNGRDPKYPWQFKADVIFDDGTTFSPSMCVQQFNRDKTFNQLEDVSEAIERSAKRQVKLWSWQDVGHLFDFGYTLTAHKSQGSSFKDVMVIVDMPSGVGEMDRRKWIYTSITRSSDKLVVIE